MVRSAPFQVHPLRPVLVKPFHRPGWVYEEKVDGWRIVAYKSGPEVHLVSRTGRDWTARFPGVARGIFELPSDILVLDGEVAVFDKELVSRFDLLSDPHPDVLATPPVYVGFDVLSAHGRDLRGLPLHERREVLEPLVADSGTVFAVRRLSNDGHEAWAEVVRRGLEGFMGKDPTSMYLRGGPTRLWLKSKVRHEGEFVVGGLVETSEGWSLLVGSQENGQLHYRGAVHFGVGRKLAEALRSNGLVRSTSPFSEPVPLKGVKWLEPSLTAQVSYAEIMPGGRLRAGVFRGFVAA